MANKNPNKPVNDLIKFWAEKQDKDVEPTSRSLRRPLSPNTSLPPSPLNDSFFSKNSPKDISSYSPPISPIKQSYSIHSLISEESNNNDNNRNSNSNISDNNNNNNNNNSNNPTIPTSISKKNEENDSLNKEISTTSTIRLRDYDSNKRDNKFGGPLPPVRKVTDLVSRFEKVTSPNNSVTTSPRLTPLKRSQTYAQSSPASPTALSPISRNQPSPEPISLSYSAKSRRRQTVPEPLNLSLKKTDDSDVVSKQIYDDSTTVSPISSIGNLSVEIPDFKPISTLNLDQSSKKNAITPTKEYVPEVQPEKKQTDSIQQESSLKINNIQSQKIVSESIPNPTGVVIIKKSEPEPLKQQQQQQEEERKNPTSPILSSAHSDYLDFLSETLQNSTIIQPLQTPVIPLSYPENRNNKPASLLSSETKTSVSKTKKFNIKSKTFTSRDIKSKNIPNVNNEPHHYEVSDLLPQPEPISPIRLNFSDFLLKNGSSTNLDFDFDNREDSETSTKVEDKESDDTKTELKPEVPEKDEKSFTKPVRPISGTIQFIENLKRYLQPNKHKSMNSDDLKGNLQHFKVTSESQIY